MGTVTTINGYDRKEHDGEPYGGSPWDQIVPEYRGPSDPAKGTRITCAPAGRLDWSHDGSDDDIVAYYVARVVHP